MTKRAVEHTFTGTTTPYSSYDPTATNLGDLIIQDVAGDFVGPLPIALARPMEQSTSIASIYPHVIQRTDDLFWVFLADNAAAGTSRRCVLYTYTKSTQVFSWRGWITMTYPSNATNHTIRGMRVVVHTRSNGTVAVSGTAVTGTSTTWQTNRYAVGTRIGFGTTDPTAVTTWYHSTAIGSDTTMTLAEDAGSIPGGTAYVIEELRIYSITTNATAANGGLFVCKGVNYDDFVAGGTTIAAATNTDSLKACYWLADAGTVLNIAAGGLAMSPTHTDTSHYIYAINADAATTLRIYKYDGRVALAGLASGKSTSAFVHRTGQQTVTGTISQTSSSRMATLQHGPGAGVSSLYFCTTTRVYRVPEAAITNGSVTYAVDCMIELPTGGTNTFAATNGMTSVEHAASIDRLIITTGASQRHYVTKYYASAHNFDHVMFCDNKQQDTSGADGGLTPFPSTQTAGFSVWSEDGIAFLARVSASASVNQLYAVPLSADWTFACDTENCLVGPVIATPDATRFHRVYINNARYLGSANLGLQPEPFRVFARTSGMDDDSGDWIPIDDDGDMSALTAAPEVQFMFEFRVIGPFCIPARLYNIICVYEDSSTDSHYQPSVANSNVAANRFAWRFSTAFGGTVPTLTLKIYDAVTGTLLLEDTTAASTKGLFEKSTNDGGAWGSYNTTDKANDTTYIRYTPTTFPTGVRAKAVLSQ